MNTEKDINRKESKTADLYGELHNYHVDDLVIDEITALDDFWGLGKKDFLDKTILEAGFGGMGTQIIGLLKLRPKYIYGIDLSEQNVSLAYKNVMKYSKSKNFSLQQGSILNIPFEDNFFDIVHCRGVFQHLADPNKGLGEFRRVLKKDGLLLLGVYGKGGLLAFLSVRLRGLAKKIGFGFVKKFFSFFINGDMLSAVLDHLFVPVEKRYHYQELVDLVAAHNFQLVHQTKLFMIDYSKLKNQFNSKFFYYFHKYCRNDSKHCLKWFSGILYGKSGVGGLTMVFKKKDNE